MHTVDYHYVLFMLNLVHPDECSVPKSSDRMSRAGRRRPVLVIDGPWWP